MTPLMIILALIGAVAALDAALVVLLWWRTRGRPDFVTTSDFDMEGPGCGV